MTIVVTDNLTANYMEKQGYRNLLMLWHGCLQSTFTATITNKLYIYSS